MHVCKLQTPEKRPHHQQNFAPVLCMLHLSDTVSPSLTRDWERAWNHLFDLRKLAQLFLYSLTR